jgi:DNA-binding response OmpR family regulator
MSTKPLRPLAFVVEDEPNLSQIYTRALEAAEFRAQAYLDGGEALEALKTIEPAVVVLDLHLPEVGGDEILGFIRAQQRLVATKVILITADNIRADMLDVHSDLTLLKPVSYHQLRDLAASLRRGL